MINPRTLKSLRTKQGLSQEALAARCKELRQPIDKMTISKIERGKAGTQKEMTVKALAAALRVQPEALAKEVDDQAKSALDDDALENALWLASNRYRVSTDIIRALAPLTFTVLAELHLRNRQKKLDACMSAVSDAEKKLPLGLNPAGFMRADDALFFEERSIRNKDLFNTRANDNEECLRWDWQFENHAPFPVWLQEMLSTLEEGSNLDWWNAKDGISFVICRKEAVALCEDDEDLAASLLSGSIAIRRLPSDFENDPGAKLQSLRQQREEARIEAEKLFESLGIALPLE